MAVGVNISGAAGSVSFQVPAKLGLSWPACSAGAIEIRQARSNRARPSVDDMSRYLLPSPAGIAGIPDAAGTGVRDSTGVRSGAVLRARGVA